MKVNRIGSIMNTRAWIGSGGAGFSFCWSHMVTPMISGQTPMASMAGPPPQGSRPNRFQMEVGSFLHLFALGILPICLGISMWLQQKLNPAPADPTQKMVFAWMPWVFMFMLGGFASGLVLYWIANNLITFVQQYLIMRSHGVTPDVFGNIRAGMRRSKPADK